MEGYAGYCGVGGDELFLEGVGPEDISELGDTWG